MLEAKEWITDLGTIRPPPVQKEHLRETRPNPWRAEGSGSSADPRCQPSPNRQRRPYPSPPRLPPLPRRQERGRRDAGPRDRRTDRLASAPGPGSDRARIRPPPRTPELQLVQALQQAAGAVGHGRGAAEAALVGLGADPRLSHLRPEARGHRRHRAARLSLTRRPRPGWGSAVWVGTGGQGTGGRGGAGGRARTGVRTTGGQGTGAPDARGTQGRGALADRARAVGGSRAACGAAHVASGPLFAWNTAPRAEPAPPARPGPAQPALPPPARRAGPPGPCRPTCLATRPSPEMRTRLIERARKGAPLTTQRDVGR